MLEPEMDSKAPQSIYVVGFPKSGNTWLTRLMADVLEATVASTDIKGKGAEIASEVNRRLSLPASTTFELSKVHFLPKFVFQEIDQAPTRIAYICRDFRDVVISAFFYKYNCDEADVCMKSFASLLLRPRALLKHWRCCRRLFKYVEKLSIDGWGETVGTWSQHIAEWHEVGTQRSDIDFVFVSYEELLNDTSSTVLRIVHELNVPRPSDERLQKAIERQSFTNLKKYFLELPDDADIPFGKEFNIKFLRKGRSGDWKHFLSPRMGQIIQKYHGEMLLKLEYESDPYWYSK